jgi:hypothetical protein
MKTEIFWFKERRVSELRADPNACAAIVVDLAKGVPIDQVMHSHSVKPRGVVYAIKAFRISRGLGYIEWPAAARYGEIRIWANGPWWHVALNPDEYLSVA